MSTPNPASWSMRLVPTTAFRPSTPDVVIPFQPNAAIQIINEDSTAANYVEVSFDGVNIAFRLTPGIVAGREWLKNLGLKQKIWLQAGAGSPNVHVAAE